MHLDLASDVGRLEARIDLPAGLPRAAAVVAHPHPAYGGTMRSRVVHEAAQALTRVGVAAVRFNYRGVGASSGSFTGGPAEADDLRRALDLLEARFPGTALWTVGYSFGAWLAMTAGAADGRVATLVGIAPPVELYDFSALLACRVPKFIVAAERDEVAPLGIVRRFYGQIPEPKELVVIEGADHAFDGRASEVGNALADLLGDYGDRLF